MIVIEKYRKWQQLAEWLACWTQAQKGLGSNRSRDCSHPLCLCSPSSEIGRVARATAGLAESNGSLPAGLWLTWPAGWLPRTGISSGTLPSAVEYGLPLPFLSAMRPLAARTAAACWFRRWRDRLTGSQHVRGHRRLCDLAACRRRQYVDRRPVVLVLRGPGQRPWRPRLGGRQHVRGDAGSAQSVRVDGPERRAFVGRAQQRRRRSVPTETASCLLRGTERARDGRRRRGQTERPPRSSPLDFNKAAARNESVPKIIRNDTINLFFEPQSACC